MKDMQSPPRAPESPEARWSRALARLGLRPDEIEESFARSSGPGGQNVNKVSSAVVLVHRPTGLQVRCERERSQARNRVLARQMLLDKIRAQRLEAQQAQRAKAEKLRRQKRKRPRAVQERILREKSLRSEKKESRRKLDY